MIKALFRNHGGAILGTALAGLMAIEAVGEIRGLQSSYSDDTSLTVSTLSNGGPVFDWFYGKRTIVAQPRP